MPETYTVRIREETFYLTRDQIEFDSPNYFTFCFLGDFAESETRTLQLSRDPDLFKIVLDYLSGYRVLPLPSAVIPKRMSSESALQNLLVDAEFYLLDGLVSQVNSALLQIAKSFNNPASTPSPYVIISRNVSQWYK